MVDGNKLRRSAVGEASGHVRWAPAVVAALLSLAAFAALLGPVHLLDPALPEEIPTPEPRRGASVAIQIGLLADYEFSQIYGAGTEAHMRSIIDAIDPVFVDTFGLSIQVGDVEVFSDEATSDSTFGAADPIDITTLLDAAQEYAFDSAGNGNPPAQMPTMEIVQMFSGKGVTDNAGGVAYLGFPDTRHWASVVLEQANDNNRHLASAHEIGHNLGAWHDTVPIDSNTPLEFRAACNPEDEDNTHIMNPALSSQMNMDFSDCSQMYINQYLDTIPLIQLLTIDSIYPPFGFTDGSTQVGVQVSGVVLHPADNLFCRFGGQTVPASLVNETQAVCDAPVTSTPGSTTFEFSNNGIVYSRSNMSFTYHDPDGPPILLSPGDQTHFTLTSPADLNWTISDPSTDNATFTLYRDGQIIDAGTWAQDYWVVTPIDQLGPGTYEYELVVSDGTGNVVNDTVTIRIISLPPLITPPPDITVIHNTTGNFVNWTVTDDEHDNGTFRIFVDGLLTFSGTFTPGVISFSADGWDAGTYEVTLDVEDGLGGLASDTVEVRVTFPGVDEDEAQTASASRGTYIVLGIAALIMGVTVYFGFRPARK